MVKVLFLEGAVYYVLSRVHRRYLTVRERTSNILSKVFFEKYNEQGEADRLKIAWVLDGHLEKPYMRLEHLRESLRMRVTQNALWINKNYREAKNEIYDPKEKYDIVIFFKAMRRPYQEEARRIKGYGGKVIFDANVNYYEIWGKFDTFSNEPTLEQQKDAVQMTSNADLCVGDSTKLCEVAGKHNPRTYWIPDNVDMDIFRFVRRHRQVKPVRLVWSGISFKADHLLMLKDVFRRLKDIEVILVSDRKPQVMKTLKQAVKCIYVLYSNLGYARLLSQCDIIISPKQIVNSYEAGHTEYKITLGMAAGLPAVASPQQSYIEAISYKGGGFICSKPIEWFTALHSLVKDHKLREEMGRKARQTVIEQYSTPVVAKRYYEVIKRCLAE